MKNENKKAYTRYVESDIAHLISDYIINLQSAEGIPFKALHSTPNTVVIKIANQTFIISVHEKSKLS